MRTVRLIVYLCVIICLVSSGIITAQDDEDTGEALNVRLLTQPAVDEEIVSFDLLVSHANGAIEGDLTQDNFVIGEDVEDLQITRLDDRPIGLIFIVNAGLGTELSLIQQTLTAYFADYYRDGDEVALYILDGQATSQTPRIILGDTVSDFTEAINRLTRPANYLNISTTLTDALNQAERWQEIDPERPVQVIYVAPFLNRVVEREASRQFARANIPFHVVQVHEARLDATDNMRILATNGGGLFANNQGGTLVNDSGDAVSELLTLYESIIESRVSYRISYHPATPSGEERNVTLTITAPNGSRGSITYTYEGLTLPPVIQIIEPVDISQTIILTSNVSPPEQLIANITFPDEVPRELSTLRFELIDDSTDNVILSILETNPPISQSGDVVVPWDYGEYAIPNTTTRLRLSLTITDILGYTVSSQLNGTIQFLQATPIPTITPDIPTPTPTPEPVFSEEATAAAEGGIILSPLLGLIIGLGVLVLILSFRLLRQSRRQPIVQPIYMPSLDTEAIIADEDTAPVEVITEADLAGVPKAEQEQVYARLFVMQGLQAHEIVINRKQFKIGRSEDVGCDYVIDQPFINPEHCQFRIQDSGEITLADLNSKNGTFVNGERLQPNREAIVPFGSEVQITRNISIQLNDPSSVYSPTMHMGGTQGQESRQARQFGFRPMLQVRYVDSGELPEDYEPL